jgi:hypothetical protein
LLTGVCLCVVSYKVEINAVGLGGDVERSVAWLVLAYRSPELLSELISSISPKERSVFVHVDARCNQDLFKNTEDAAVKFLESRFECPWGSFGRVSASIELLRKGLRYPATHFALLSEDSFLLYEPDEIELKLPESETIILMDLSPMGSASKPISRVSKSSPFRGDPRRQGLLIKLLDLLLTRLFVNRGWERALGRMNLFAGDSWWVISRKAAIEIIEFVDAHPQIVEFFETTWIADEHFFQTILGNSTSEYEFTGSPMLANWSSGSGSNPPYFLTEQDEKWIRSNRKGYLFARKIEKHSESFAAFTKKLRAQEL